MKNLLLVAVTFIGINAFATDVLPLTVLGSYLLVSETVVTHLDCHANSFVHSYTQVLLINGMTIEDLEEGKNTTVHR